MRTHVKSYLYYSLYEWTTHVYKVHCSSNIWRFKSDIFKSKYISLFLTFQAEFSEINLASYSDTGTMVDIQVTRQGTKVVR